MNVLAVDVGFGNTKHCRAAGARTRVGLFPSIAAPTSASIFEGFNQSADGLLEDDPGLANVRGFSAHGELHARSAGTR